jgi:hypothetical protein
VELAEIRWTHGRTVCLCFTPDVQQRDAIVSTASYVLLFTRGDQALGPTLQVELAPFGVDIDVRTPDPMAREIVVHVSPCRWRFGHQAPSQRHDRWD